MELNATKMVNSFLWANDDECLGELNDLVFLTREEAEKKLEEMKNE